LSEDGFIVEVFSSFQGEGGSVRGSCAGKRQVFVRLAGCNLASGEMGTGGCLFCDSPEAKRKEVELARVEMGPEKGKFRDVKNPLGADVVASFVEELATPDLHSVSLTGGEPLWQPLFLRSLLEELRSKGRRAYLETNGSLPKALGRIVGFLDYACVDVKDESAHAASRWKDLLDREFESIEILMGAGVKTFSKVVVTAQTLPRNIELIARRLSGMGCPLALQVVTPIGGLRPPSRRLLFVLNEAAAKHLQPDELTISFQTHRLLGLP